MSVVLFPPPFYFVFDISNLLSYIQNNFKLYALSPLNGNHFSSKYIYLLHTSPAHCTFFNDA